MTSEKLHDALNLLPADLVAGTDALRTKPKKPQVHWQRWAAMAACLAVVLLAGTMFSYFFGHMGSSKTAAAVDKAPMSLPKRPTRRTPPPISMPLRKPLLRTAVTPTPPRANPKPPAAQRTVTVGTPPPP